MCCNTGSNIILVWYTLDMNNKNITQDEFEKLKTKWISLNKEYDNLFLSFLETPQIKTAEQISKFKEMQKEIYELEDTLYEIAEGTTTLI